MIYALLLIHFVILAIGGIYKYAKVPLGYWMQDWFGFTRNNYDKIGHFAQGFVPALSTREILLHTSPLKSGKWLNFFPLEHIVFLLLPKPILACNIPYTFILIILVN